MLRMKVFQLQDRAEKSFFFHSELDKATEDKHVRLAKYAKSLAVSFACLLATSALKP